MQRPVEARLVGAQHAAPGRIREAGQATRWPPRGLRPQQPGAHHRRGRQRDDQRDHDRGRQRDRELLEQAADDAAHEQQRNEHRHETQGDRQHGEADFAGTQQGGLEAVHALLDVAARVLEHHDRVVDHEARGHREGHQAEVVQAEAEQVHHAERSQQRDDRGRRGHERGARAAQEEAHDHHHQHDGDQQGDLDLVQRRADRIGAVAGDLERDVRRKLRAQLRQQCPHAVHRLDDVGARLPGDEDDHGGHAVEQAERASVLGTGVDRGHVAQAHRRAVAPGDHEAAIFDGHLIDGARDGRGCRGHGGAAGEARVDLQAALGAVERALGPVGAGRLQGRAHVLERDTVARQAERVELHAHGRQRRAAEFHVAHARRLGELLLYDVGHGVVDLSRRTRARREREDDDRRVGGVGLAVGRVAAQGGRKVGSRGIDRGLHFACRAVDVALEIELQRDARGAVAAVRGDLVDTRDHAEAAFQRRGHAAGHGLRARTRQARLHEDDGEVHLRQRRHGQHEERGHAGQCDADGEQDRGDRASDERLRQVHALPFALPVASRGPR